MHMAHVCTVTGVACSIHNMRVPLPASQLASRATHTHTHIHNDSAAASVTCNRPGPQALGRGKRSLVHVPVCGAVLVVGNEARDMWPGPAARGRARANGATARRGGEVCMFRGGFER